MARRTTLIFMLILSVVGLGLPALAGSPSLTLTYSNFFPPTHVQSQLAEQWCQEVEKRTQGRIKVQYFPGQTLTQARQTYDGVVQGMSDVGMSCLAYTRGRFPVMEVVDLPLGYPSGGVATKVVNQVYEDLKPKELSDTVVMYLHAHGPGLLHTIERPVAKLEELKGLKIRATGTSAKVVKALGGTPVAMPMPETYQALQKGVMDGSVYPMESNKGWKLGEVTKYGTLHYSMAYTTSFFVVINKAKWAQIPPQDQQIIRQINSEWVVKHGQAWDQSDKEGREFFLSQPDRKYIELSPQEAERWKKAVQPVMAEYLGDMKKRGLDGEKALAAAQKALAGAGR